MHRHLSFLLLLILFVITPFAIAPSLCSAGTPAEANFVDSAVASALGNITSMAWAPDGSNRLFLTIKTGPVKIIQNGAVLPTNFYTFSPYLGHNETGVLSIAFDPSYAVNKFVYIFYTASSTIQKIVRVTDVSNVGQSLVEIKGDLPTVGQNHDGGAIVIAPDNNGNGNYLYWSIGNLGNSVSRGEGANLTDLASKMGRINLDGSVPNDNPFYDISDGIGPTDFIWARGLRNPFTMTVQPSTKQIWMNIVGDIYEQIFIVQKKDYLGDRYRENTQDMPPALNPAGITPKIKYLTNSADSRTITSAVRASNVVTFTTSVNNGFRRGEKITIAGVSDASFNGSFFVASTPTLTTFTIAQTGANASSSSGTASTQNLGGCVTGGTFYTATAFPTAYQGNFFFGDLNSNKIFRAVLDGSNNVSSVDLFATGVGPITDIAAGPDGALYYVNHNGDLRRITYSAPAQGIVVSATSLGVTEGSSASFGINLSSLPSANVVVNIARSSGDTDVTVGSGATLTFTPANYAQPQLVQIAAAQDVDTANDTAVLTISSTGLTSRTVNVTVSDDDIINLVLSTNNLNMTEGASANFSVQLSNQPASTVTVTTTRTSGDADITVSAGSTLTFQTSNYNVNQTVTVSAAEDADTVGDSATLTVSSAGVTSRTIPVAVTDNDAVAPSIVSPAVTAAVQGAPYSYDVNANGLPAPTYSLTTSPSGMTINATSGVISWTPAATGSFPVTVRAASGILPDATQSFSISVAADTAPTCTITSPKVDTVVAGPAAEFFGDAFDDVGTTKAEFYVDNVLKYTDINTEKHYHINGGHLLWNSMALSNGTHPLKMTVYDTKNQSGSCQVTATIFNPPLPPSPPQNLRVVP